MIQRFEAEWCIRVSKQGIVGSNAPVRRQAIIWIDDAFRVRCEQKAHNEEFRCFFAVSLNKLLKNSPDTGDFKHYDANINSI